MKVPKRTQDIRVEVTRTVFREFASRFWVRKGTIMDGHLDENGNFCHNNLTIYPTHFKILGRFYLRKEK